MPFSFAIFSADWPMREAGRRLGDGRRVGDEVARAQLARRPTSRAPSDLRLLRLDEGPRHAPAVQDRHVGEALGSARRSPPPRGRGGSADATSAIAWLAEAQARFTVCAGTDSRQAGAAAPTSRPRFGRLHRRDHLPHHHRADRRRVDLGALEQLADAGLAEVERRSGRGRRCPSGRTACDSRPRSRLFGCSWGFPPGALVARPVAGSWGAGLHGVDLRSGRDPGCRPSRPLMVAQRPRAF